MQDDANVPFLTHHEDTQVEEIQRAREATRDSETPKLLSVPFRSRLDESDYQQIAVIAAASGRFMNASILARAEVAQRAGRNGLIVSGQTIALCRK